jgi:hypothetical protein
VSTHVDKIFVDAWSRTAPKSQAGHKTDPCHDSYQYKEELNMVNDALVPINQVRAKHWSTLETFFFVGTLGATKATFLALVVFTPFD